MHFLYLKTCSNYLNNVFLVLLFYLKIHLYNKVQQYCKTTKQYFKSFHSTNRLEINLLAPHSQRKPYNQTSLNNEVLNLVQRHARISLALAISYLSTTLLLENIASVPKIIDKNRNPNNPNTYGRTNGSDMLMLR